MDSKVEQSSISRVLANSSVGDLSANAMMGDGRELFSDRWLTTNTSFHTSRDGSSEAKLDGLLTSCRLIPSRGNGASSPSRCVFFLTNLEFLGVQPITRKHRNDLAFLQAWNSRLQNYVGPGPVLHGAYGHRLHHHLGLDQLERTFAALSHNPDTRQAVLQIWDSAIDLPTADGSPADPDIPCNVVSLLKVREGKLEWLQIIRSNDLFLGVPHNFVQFTCLQEIMAGWLELECGAYHQVSDSLHLYERDKRNVLASESLVDAPHNTDSLKLPRVESELAFRELAHRMEQMIQPGLKPATLEQLSGWEHGPESYRNILLVLVAERARRQKWPDVANDAISRCTNSVFRYLWKRWRQRVSTSSTEG